MTASSGRPESPTPAAGEVVQMNYLRFMNQFNHLFDEQEFSATATVLYVRLVNLFNKRRQWDKPEQVNVPFLQLLSGSAENTVKKALAELQDRGLIAFTPAGKGRKKTGPLYLLKVHRLQRSLPDEKPANFDGFTDGFSGEDELKPSVKPSVKPSKFEDTIRVEERVRDVTTEGRAAAKKMGAAGLENSGAGAPQAEGAAADVGTRVYPLPLDEGETIRQQVPAHLPESDPNKYAAVPRDVEMVEAYLRGHHNPEISQHAGKAQLFWDHYEKNGWNNKHGKPIHSWQAAAREFSFIDYRQARTAEHAARQAKLTGGQLDKRALAVDSAEALLQQREREAGNG